MSKDTRYLVPAAEIEVEEVIRGSQFITLISLATSVDDARAKLKTLNTMYPNATHHCWAYIIGNPASTSLIASSDDGEPPGTAGKPMLNVLQHSGIGDVLAVCTRFYGGTKLGTGGLARAYGGGVKLGLSVLETVEKISYKKLELTLAYSQQNDFEHLLEDFQSQNYKHEFTNDVSVTVEIAAEQLDAFASALSDKFKGQIDWKLQ